MASRPCCSWWLSEAAAGSSGSVPGVIRGPGVLQWKVLQAAGVPGQGGREHGGAQNAQRGLVVFYNHPALPHLLIKMPNLQFSAKGEISFWWQLGRARRGAMKTVCSQPGVLQHDGFWGTLTWIALRSDTWSFECEAAAHSSATVCHRNFAGCFGVSRAGSR